MGAATATRSPTTEKHCDHTGSGAANHHWDVTEGVDLSGGVPIVTRVIGHRRRDARALAAMGAEGDALAV